MPAGKGNLQLSKAQTRREDKLVFQDLTGLVVFPIAYKGGDTEPGTKTDANREVKTDNGKSTTSSIVRLANGPISFQGGLQRLTAQSVI